MKGKIRSYIKDHARMMALVSKSYSRLLGRNKMRIAKKNRIHVGAVLMKRTTIAIVGIDNTVVIKNMSRLSGCTIQIRGDHNSLVIGHRASMCGTTLFIEDDGNRVTIGERTTIDRGTVLAAIEGTSLEIGDDCMFSSNVHVVTGDSHSVLDASGARVNPSRSIRVENHVWIGTRAMLLKGSHIAANSIVGASAVVTRDFNEQNVVVAGNPASVAKREVNWVRERL